LFYRSSLSFAGNNLGNIGARLVGLAMQRQACKMLNTLNLSNNRIGLDYAVQPPVVYTALERCPFTVINRIVQVRIMQMLNTHWTPLMHR